MNTSKAIDKEPCPECRKQGGDNSGDNLVIYDDGHKHCFACGYHLNKNKEERFEDLSNTFTYEYMPWRGITKNTFEKYGCKTKINSEGKPVGIGFPYPNGSMKVRNFPKEFYSQGDISKAGLFGRNLFTAGSHKYVTITEGELDALSLYQALGSPVVSVHSSSSAKLDASQDRSWLNSFERIYLAFDADDAGRKAEAAVASLFDYNKVFRVAFPGGTRKDANDYLKAGERDELINLWWNAKKYLPETIVSSFHDFDKIIKEPIKVGVSYPYPTLNHMTYGIRTGESVLITAQEGVGKTEIMHDIEYKLLMETEDAIGAIYLEEPKRRHLQALAGRLLKRPVHLPDCGVSADETFRAVQEVVRSDDRLHLYSHFGSDDPEVILDTIRFLVSARGCKYILLDHITMVVSGLGGKDERTALDFLSTRLEMMVKELDFSLILVSHVNDDGLTRGSRNISKIADIRIDLKRDVTSSDPVVRRSTHLTVSKNRFCGRTGPAGVLLFDPMTYTLEEDMGYGDPSAANDNSRIEEMAA